MSAIGPGDFVECVDATSGPGAWMPGEAPVVGAIYTVERVFVNGWGIESLHLRELKRHPGSVAFWGGGPLGYNIKRFRPIYRPKSSLIEQLKRPVSEPA